MRNLFRLLWHRVLAVAWRLLAVPVVVPCAMVSIGATCCLLVSENSCKFKSDYSKEIFRLDSVKVFLDKSEKILQLADTGAFRVSYNAAAGNLHDIMEKLAKDTVKKKMAMFLSDACRQSGSIANLLDNKKYLEQGIRETKQRINNLKHDLSENMIDKNKAQEYVVHEINSSEKIYHLVIHSVEQAKLSSAKLDSMRMEITHTVDSLNLRSDKSGSKQKTKCSKKYKMGKS